MSNQIYLALGANLGRRIENLQRAIEAIGEVAAVEAISSVYETAPWGVTDQPDFLNICIAAQTDLDPAELLDACKSIERKIGRDPGPKWGPRLIDIDIIFFNDLILDQDQLRIPHPHYAERAFVLVPLADVAAEYRDPRNGLAVSALLSSVDTSTVWPRNGAEFSLRRPANLPWGVKSYVMGILNVTPDSFSGDGLLKGKDSINGAVAMARDFVTAGADILDIGGESTRPGSQPITQEEELRRVLPVIAEVRRAVDVPISVDTYRAAVAEAALDAGADWVNDVWGLRMDGDMAGLIARRGCPTVIMHNRSRPKNVEQEEILGGRYVGIQYGDLLDEVRAELQESIDLALDHGARRSQLILDPGIGFGKTVTQNFQLLNKLNMLKAMGYPILVGTSRKSFIGYTLDLPPEARLEGTAATVAIAIDRGADIVRVHDVRAMVRVARITDQIVRS